MSRNAAHRNFACGCGALAQLLEALGDVADLEDLDDRRVGSSRRKDRSRAWPGPAPECPCRPCDTRPARFFWPKAFCSSSPRYQSGRSKYLCHGSPGRAGLHRIDHVAPACRARPRRRCDRLRSWPPMSGPVSASTVSKPRPKARVWWKAARIENTPTRLAMKFARVLGADHALAERGGEEPLQRIQHVRLRVARRDQSTRYM